MASERFETLLIELSAAMKVRKKFTPDKNGACMLKFKNGISVQMEPDNSGHMLLLAAEIAPLSQGRYRENVCREALKANGLPPPNYGVFAWGKKTEALLLTDQLFFEELTGDKFVEYLRQFVQKAGLWKEGLSKGEIPSFMGHELSFGAGTRGTGGVFGLVR
jgi:hypothetical protein